MGYLLVWLKVAGSLKVATHAGYRLNQINPLNKPSSFTHTIHLNVWDANVLLLFN